jgi:hypothetical protein
MDAQTGTETESRTCAKAAQKGEGHGYCETQEGRWAAVVRRHIQNLRYGEVILTVHDGRVVQIERSEKVRF